MDIRRFFASKQGVKRKAENYAANEHTTESKELAACTSQPSINVRTTPSFSDLDIGLYLKPENVISNEMKLRLLQTPWTPDNLYDFKNDVEFKKRSFRLDWLGSYAWLCYSSAVKGALCRICVLFRPAVHRGAQGTFIVKPFTNYKHFHESAKAHAASQWHLEAISSSKSFQDVSSMKTRSIYEQVNTAAQKEIEANRQKLASIVSSIVFCATHDLPLRGKTDETAVFNDLLRFRIESGDRVLEDHLEFGAKNASYTSHHMQNEILSACNSTLLENLLTEIKQSTAFSVLADETADISGTEQLSIGIRYLLQDNECGYYIKEEFLGFTPLDELTSESISSTIIKTLQNYKLDMNRLVGQGYDGCATMAGRLAGVQKRINDRYPKALFFHCASHKLNLVVNDLNVVTEVRNTVGTVKDIINFFRESTLRRKMIPAIPLLCETRWSAKYKSIRIFSENFCEIVNALKTLSEISNNATRNRANQLYCAATSTNFIVCVNIISIYSSKLEPVTNKLQQEDLDLESAVIHIQELINIFHIHRLNSEEEFSSIFQKAKLDAEELGLELKCPRRASRQTHRSNPPSESLEEFFRRAIFIPYLDSLCAALSDRFVEINGRAFDLFQLHPKNMKKLTKAKYLEIAKNIQEFYGNLLDNFQAEAKSWFEVWMLSKKNVEVTSIKFIDLLQHADKFYPSVSKAIQIALSLPVTTCTAERSFSTLRRVKTWLRSTMLDERLSALCMMSVHKKRVQEQKKDFLENVLKIFTLQPRRMQLLFKQ